MNRILYATSLALLLVTQALSADRPTIQAPETVYVQVGDWAFFTVTTDGKGLEFIIPSGVKTFPQDKLKNPNEIGVRAEVEGTYRIIVYTGNEKGPSKPTYIDVIAGKAPRPPTPGPVVPDPKTPDPKQPDPPPYIVDAVLVKQFAQALEADIKAFGPMSGQAQLANKLGNVYLETAKLLEADTTNTLTFGNLYTITFNASTNQKIPRRDQALTSVRKVIDDLGKHNPGTEIGRAHV